MTKEETFLENLIKKYITNLTIETLINDVDTHCSFFKRNIINCINHNDSFFPLQDRYLDLELDVDVGFVKFDRMDKKFTNYFYSIRIGSKYTYFYSYNNNVLLYWGICEDKKENNNNNSELIDKIVEKYNNDPHFTITKENLKGLI
jgi:hypothetical protein